MKLFDTITKRKASSLQYEYLQTGQKNGWIMNSGLYAKCPKCGYYMSLDPTQSDVCPCGNLIKDSDCGRFGAQTGDETIKIYQKKNRSKNSSL